MTTDSTAAIDTPDIGRVTWEAEGMEGGPYHSRKLHVPTGSSGLTLGRGYDMKERSSASIAQDLVDAGVSPDTAALISQAAGLTGAAARQFIQDRHLETFEITPAGQKALFLHTYAALKKDVQRISDKPEVVQAYGACALDSTDPAIVDILVDLRFRGDYTGASRAWVQRPAARNDLPAFIQTMKDAANWTNVPRDRFQRRYAFLELALAAKA